MKIEITDKLAGKTVGQLRELLSLGKDAIILLDERRVKETVAVAAGQGLEVTYPLPIIPQWYVNQLGKKSKR